MVDDITPSQALSMLDTMEEGRFRVTLDETLEEFIKALHKHQQNSGPKAKGRITINLNAVYDGTHVIVEGQVETKLPKPVRGASIFFRTNDNGLSTQHPKQLVLPLVDATEGQTREMRVV